MIDIRNITKDYGSLRVLHNVSLSVNEGEILTIVGPSGAGKTTMLQIAGTLSRPDSGSVLFDGTDLFSLKDRRLSDFRNRNIGFIFQFHQLLPEFSAIENVAMPALIAGEKKRNALHAAEELLINLRLADRLQHKPAQLSGGERQRVAIARALINKPRVVLADEPTGSLDSKNRDEILAIIENLRQNTGQTFVIVTHDPFMASIADRTVTMADGQITHDSQKENPEPLSDDTDIINENPAIQNNSEELPVNTDREEPSI